MTNNGDDQSIHDIPSWAACLDAHAFTPDYISFSSRSQDSHSSRDAPIDSTDLTASGLRLNFDKSCLDSLDDQLLLYPTESFADVCWGDAVYDCTDRAQTPTQRQTDRVVPYALQRRLSIDSDDSGSDDDLTTPVEEEKGRCNVHGLDLVVYSVSGVQL